MMSLSSDGAGPALMSSPPPAPSCESSPPRNASHPRRTWLPAHASGRNGPLGGSPTRASAKIPKPRTPGKCQGTEHRNSRESGRSLLRGPCRKLAYGLSAPVLLWPRFARFATSRSSSLIVFDACILLLARWETSASTGLSDASFCVQH